jgi:hypothetical protein
MKRKIITAVVAAALILTAALLLFLKSCRNGQVLKQTPSGIFTANNTGGGHPAIGNSTGHSRKLLKLFGREFTKGILVMKTDIEGNSVWAKVFDAGGVAWGDTVYEANDRNFIATVTKYDVKSGAVDSYIYTMNPEGRLIGIKPLGTEDYELRLSGGGSVNIGCAGSQGTVEEQIFIDEHYTNGLGKVRILGRHGLDWPSVHIISQDGEDIMFADDETGLPDVNQIALIKKKPDGTRLWASMLGGTEHARGFCIAPSDEGGAVVAGVITKEGNDNILLECLDAQGNTLWTRTPGQDKFQEAFCIENAGGGNYVVCGKTGSGNEECRPFLLKTGPDGSTLWYKVFDRKGDNEVYFISRTKDGGYIMTGVGSI